MALAPYTGLGPFFVSKPTQSQDMEAYQLIKGNVDAATAFAAGDDEAVLAILNDPSKVVITNDESWTFATLQAELGSEVVGNARLVIEAFAEGDAESAPLPAGFGEYVRALARMDLELLSGPGLNLNDDGLQEFLRQPQVDLGHVADLGRRTASFAQQHLGSDLTQDDIDSAREEVLKQALRTSAAVAYNVVAASIDDGSITSVDEIKAAFVGAI